VERVQRPVWGAPQKMRVYGRVKGAPHLAGSILTQDP
jgi:hypothetical protein